MPNLRPFLVGSLQLLGNFCLYGKLSKGPSGLIHRSPYIDLVPAHKRMEQAQKSMPTNHFLEVKEIYEEVPGLYRCIGVCRCQPQSLRKTKSFNCL